MEVTCTDSYPISVETVGEVSTVHYAGGARGTQHDRWWGVYDKVSAIVEVSLPQRVYPGYRLCTMLVESGAHSMTDGGGYMTRSQL